MIHSLTNWFESMPAMRMSSGHVSRSEVRSTLLARILNVSPLKLERQAVNTSPKQLSASHCKRTWDCS